MRINVKIPNSSAVVAGQTAHWDMPIGRRYHRLSLQYSGVTLAQLKEIRISANSEPIHRYSAAARDTMNQFDGMAAAGGILEIYFDRYRLYNQQGEENTAIQTAAPDPKTGVAITKFELDIDIDAAAAAPAISVVAQQSNNLSPAQQQALGIPQGPGLIRRILQTQIAFAASSWQEIASLPKGTEGTKFQWINRAFFFTAQTTEMEFWRSGFALFQRTAALNNRAQTNGVRVPQANVFVIDPTEQGYDFEPIALLQSNGVPYQDMRYRFNLAAAETFNAYVEYLGKLQGA